MSQSERRKRRPSAFSVLRAVADTEGIPLSELVAREYAQKSDWQIGQTYGLSEDQVGLLRRKLQIETHQKGTRQYSFHSEETYRQKQALGTTLGQRGEKQITFPGNEEPKEALERRFQAGTPQGKVAEEIGVSKDIIRRRIQKFGIAVPYSRGERNKQQAFEKFHPTVLAWYAIDQFARLTPDEATVLKERFVTESYKSMKSIQQLADLLHCSPGRISLLQRKAIQKYRQ
jgi:hypothetical protein